MLLAYIKFAQWFVLFFFIGLSIGYLFLLIMSIPDIYTRFKEGQLTNILDIMKSYSLPPVTVLMAAYNEEDFIAESTISILKSDYSNVNLIVIIDGATDSTLKILFEKYDLISVSPLIDKKIETIAKIKSFYISKSYPNLTVIDKEHSDKSDSLNIGINACRTPLFVSVDADTLLDRDAISKLIFYFLTMSYPVAAGGGVYILNGCQYEDGMITHPKVPYNPIVVFQVCEYLRSFLFGRAGWNAVTGALCYAGAFSLINRHAAVEIGGYDVNNLAQDFEIITHLHERKIENKFPYSIGFTPAAISWTDVPCTLSQYWHQRSNWQFYSLDSLLKHFKMLFNPRYGIVGMFTYPFYLFGEILGVLVEFMGYSAYFLSYWLGILDRYWTFMFLLLCWGFATFLTMATALMNSVTFNPYRKLNDVFLMLLYSIIENIGFRQFSVICRTYATFKYFFVKVFEKMVILYKKMKKVKA